MIDYQFKANPTLYDDLGLSPHASSIEIRERFFELAKASHPDLASPTASLRRFKQIVSAYFVLRDFQRRRNYDAFLAKQASGDSFEGHSSARPKSAQSEAPMMDESEGNRPDGRYRFHFGSRRESNLEATAEPTSLLPERGREREPSRLEQSSSFRSATDKPSLDEAIERPHQRAAFQPRRNQQRRKSRAPILALMMHALAILGGAMGAAVLAHYILILIEPSSGGLLRLLK